MEPKSSFITVKCDACENEQTIFSHASKQIKCEKCGMVLAEPSGGKAVLTKQAKTVKVQ